MNPKDCEMILIARTGWIPEHNDSCICVFKQVSLDPLGVWLRLLFCPWLLAIAANAVDSNYAVMGVFRYKEGLDSVPAMSPK